MRGTSVHLVHMCLLITTCTTSTIHICMGSEMDVSPEPRTRSNCLQGISWFHTQRAVELSIPITGRPFVSRNWNGVIRRTEIIRQNGMQGSIYLVRTDWQGTLIRNRLIRSNGCGETFLKQTFNLVTIFYCAFVMVFVRMLTQPQWVRKYVKRARGIIVSPYRNS